MKLLTLIARLNEEVVQLILGDSFLRIQQVLHHEQGLVFNKKEVLLGLFGREGLLLNPLIRKLLLDRLREDEIKHLLKELNINSTDPYGTISKVKFSSASENLRILFKFFELEPPSQKSNEESLEEKDSFSIIPAYPLFPHQRDAVDKLNHFFIQDKRRVLLHMPTGSGKTRTTMHVISDHFISTSPGVVVWLAYSEELCQQAYDEFKLAWSHLGNRELKICRLWGSAEFDLKNYDDCIIIAGLTKFNNLIVKNSKEIRNLAGRCSLIIIDEAHQAIAKTYSSSLDVLFYYRRDCRLLGLSATPGRAYADPTEDQKLADFFDGNKVSLQVKGYKSPIEYLMKEGYLANPEFHYVDYQTKFKINPNETISGDEFSDDILMMLEKEDLRNYRIVQETVHLTHKHKRIIVFAISVSHADTLAAVLLTKGINARSLSSKTPKVLRRQILEEFKNSDDSVRIICNYGILTTGFDAPRTSAAVIARPTKSLVLFSQMVGRATRGVKAGGNKKAEIVTLVDNCLPGYRDMVESFTNWDKVWKQEE